MMAAVPDDVRREVTAKLYTRFDDLAWEEMTATEKSEAYGRFVTDQELGGALTQYLARDRIRVWIKDGPAKEYTRALEGVGPYVGHTRRAYAGPQDVIDAVLGEGWTVREDSVENKPMRCWADGPQGSRYVIWGGQHNLKDLVWHAVLHRDHHKASTPTVVLTRREVTKLPKDVRQRAERVCALVGADCREARRPVVTKSPHIPEG